MKHWAASLVLVLSGCAIGGDHIRWTEEVKLSDGSVIQVQRHIEVGESGFPIQERGFDKYNELCYPPMGIHWKSKPGYQPDIFDIVDGKAYMHVPVASSSTCWEQNSPETGAIYFVWDNGRWKRISHGDFPEKSKWNLLMQTKGGTSKTDPKGIVSLEEKARKDSGLMREQKRFGWTRINDSYFLQKGCTPYGKGPGWCADNQCTRLLDIPADPKSIFYDDDNTCHN